MGNKKSLKTNASGYSDPTAFNAICEADRLDKELINDVLEDIFKVCKDYGVFIYGDIKFVERNSKRKGSRRLYYNEYLDWKKN